jgi:dATP pyrophosphohydrolase
MVGGKISDGEKAWETAKREFQEETALFAQRWWAVPSLNHFYDHKRNHIHLIPAFAVECEAFATPILNEEHVEFKWVKAGDCEKFILWPEQNRLILLIDKILQKQILTEWLLED